jgi:hypothetical protein
MSRRLYAIPVLLFASLLAAAPPAAAAGSHAHLRVSPNPVTLKQRFTVTLTGATPGAALTFLATPEREGFGGGNMGTHRVSAAGTVQFRYGPFKNKLDVGHWTVTVVRKGAGTLTTGSFNVVMPRKTKKHHTS